MINSNPFRHVIQKDSHILSFYQVIIDMELLIRQLDWIAVESEEISEITQRYLTHDSRKNLRNIRTEVILRTQEVFMGNILEKLLSSSQSPE